MIAWAQHGQWPIAQYVSSEMAKRRITDTVAVLNSFPTFGTRSPTGRSYCDVRYDHTHPAPPADSEVSLTISGLGRHQAGEDMALAFVAVLRYAADKYARTPMDATKVVQVEISREEFAEIPSQLWPDDLMRAVGVLLQREWPSGVQYMGGPPENWRILVNQDVLRYSGVTVDGYIDLIKQDIETAAAETARWYAPAPDLSTDVGGTTVATGQRMQPRYAVRELLRLINDAQNDPRVRAATPMHEQWKASVRAVMERSLGTEASVLRDFNDVRYHIGVYTGAPGEADEDAQYFAAQVDSAIAYINAAIYELNLSEGDPVQAIESSQPPKPSAEPATIFLVHGHDDAAKHEVARFIQDVTGQSPIILDEKPNEGRTIVEKFEKHAAASSYAVVLLTPDDVGRVAGALPEDDSGRARQNVVFELGYFFGRLGRGNVCVLNAGVEKPSDVDGLVYISYPTSNWKLQLAKELQAAEIQINTSRLLA
jgi:predicted nucleotide-binding protein